MRKTRGTVLSARSSRASSSTRGSVTPAARARWVARWITGPVGERIRERDAQLDDVGAAPRRLQDEPARRRERGIARGEVRDEGPLASSAGARRRWRRGVRATSTPASAADSARMTIPEASASADSTVCTSLSPRPDRPTTMLWLFGMAGASRSDPGHGVGGLERGHDAFEPRQGLEGVERFRVRHRLVLEPSPLLVVRVLGPGARIVETRGDRVRLGDLAVVVLEHVAHAAVEHADRPRCRARRRGDPWRRRVRRARRPRSARGVSLMKGQKRPMALDPPPTQATSTSGSLPELPHLRPRLVADDAVEIADHHGIGMRTEGGAQEIVRGPHVGDPVAQRLVDGVLQRLASRSRRGRRWRRAASCGRR